MSENMKILVRAFWDEDAKVWAAQADGELGLFAEAETVEELIHKLPVMAKDLLEGDYDGSIAIELVTTSKLFVAA